MDQYAKQDFQTSYGRVQAAPRNFQHVRTASKPSVMHGVRIGDILKRALKSCPKK